MCAHIILNGKLIHVLCEGGCVCWYVMCAVGCAFLINIVITTYMLGSVTCMCCSSGILWVMSCNNYALPALKSSHQVFSVEETKYHAVTSNIYGSSISKQSMTNHLPNMWWPAGGSGETVTGSSKHAKPLCSYASASVPVACASIYKYAIATQAWKFCKTGIIYTLEMET